MKQKFSGFWVFPLVTLMTLIADPVWAGPGGQIAKAVFQTFWGKAILALLVVIFLPVIVMSLVKEHRAKKLALHELAYLTERHRAFEWVNVRQRALACFHRVHAAWRKEDTEEASAYMTQWYWQNQQMVFLDRWAAEGLVNHCTVKSVKSVKPLFVEPGEGMQHEGAIVVVSISADTQDYLARRSDGEVIEGNKKFKEVETIWTLTLESGTWKVSNIEPFDALANYLDLIASRPSLEGRLPA